MAITVNIYYSSKNGNAKKFYEKMITSGLVEEIRSENGNLRYEYFMPMDDKETLLLIDIWKDQASLDIHHASAMMDKITQLREKYDLHMKVERYISEDANVLENDEKFLRK